MLYLPPTHKDGITLSGTTLCVPGEQQGKNVSFCLAEIGCRYNGKSSQLRKKRELLLEHFT